MSAASRHISHGMAGETGAPRPALVIAACGLSVVEHDSVAATTSAARTARVLLNFVIFDIRDLGRDYRALAPAPSRLLREHDGSVTDDVREDHESPAQGRN